jgi:membrane protein
VSALAAERLWSREPLGPFGLERLRSFAQLAILVAQGFARDQLLLRAHQLTYLTLLSLIPALALAVTLVDLIGGGEQVIRELLDRFAAAAPADVRAFILERVAAFDFGTLGPLGGGLLLATTVLAIGNVERALNAVWGVREVRPWARRIPDYLAVLVITPLAVGVAIPLRATLESQRFVAWALQHPLFDALYHAGLRQLPTLLLVLGFSFLYGFLPNTRVRPVSALLGGVAAALLFGLAQHAYVALSIGAARSNAVFGALAGAALFLVWIYLSWSIFLLGAEVAYAHQTLPLYRREVRGEPASPAARETLGLAIAVQCARAFREGGPPWTADALSEALDVPLRTVRGVLDELARAQILSECGGEREGAYQLARPLEQVRVAELLAALRGSRETALAAPEVARAVAEVLAEVDRAAAAAAEGRSLRDLVDALGPAVDRPVAAP